MKRCLLLCFAAAFLLGSCGYVPNEGRRITVYQRQEPEGEEIVSLENEFLRLDFFPETAEIIVTNKNTGAAWRSNPENAARDPAAQEPDREALRSQFTLAFADESGLTDSFSSYGDSLVYGRREYGLAAGGLEVRYTVGDAPQTYYIPPAAPEERMAAFLERMDGDGRFAVESSYRLYDINRLYSTDNRAELLERFPDLGGTRIYALPDNLKEYLKEELEQVFRDAGYTIDDYEQDAARYQALREEELPVFNITLRYELDGNALVARAPYDSLAWRGGYPLSQINLLPYFGAGGPEDSGYLFVPDGSGALIDFNNGRRSRSAFVVPVYGWDESRSRLAAVSETEAPFPVFGIQKNGEAVVCIIEEGAPYASIAAETPGKTSWNAVYAQFSVMYGEKDGSRTNGFYQYEPGLPPGGEFRVRYAFCAEPGYVGMAKEYRAYLQNSGLIPARLSGGGDAPPLAVEILGAVDKIQPRLGIPVNLPLPLTSFEETSGIIADLSKRGWKNVLVKLTGWFGGGLNHAAPLAPRPLGELGNAGGFRALLETAADAGYRVYGEADFLHIRDAGIFDGFDPNRDAARFVSNGWARVYSFNPVTFVRAGASGYLARPAYMENLIRGFALRAGELGLDGIAFRSAGSRLSGDYNADRRVRREESMAMQRSLLEELRQNGAGVMVNAGFDYVLGAADIITGMALESRGVDITNRDVPFYQIALHGLAPFTGKAVNLAEDYTKHLLDTAASGAGLYFSFMARDSAVLQRTNFRQYYSNEYAKWAADADAVYQRFARDFRGLYGQTIENHLFLTNAVTVTEYSGGTRVAVNYGKAAYSFEGVSIPALSYAVLRKEE